jgi:hypothetical protein
MKAHPGMERDPQLQRWRGLLEHDVGDYAAAVKSLVAALDLLSAGPVSRDELVETGLALCETLSASGDPRAAAQMFDRYLSPFGGDLKVRLMRARLLADGHPSPDG